MCRKETIKTSTIFFYNTYKILYLIIVTWSGGEDKDVSISMFDNAGRLLWTRSRDIDNSRSVDISVSNLRPGMYYLKVESKTVRKTAKLVKK